jgi:hypothetical protein
MEINDSEYNNNNNNNNNNISDFTASIVSTQPIITFNNKNKNNNNNNNNNIDFKTIENEITEFSVCMSDTLY